MKNTKMQCKMKKMMLVAGMATAMNLTIGIQNEGWTMMKDEEEYSISKRSVYDPSLILRSALNNNQLNEEDIIYLNNITAKWDLPYEDPEPFLEKYYTFVDQHNMNKSSFQNKSYMGMKKLKPMFDQLNKSAKQLLVRILKENI
jgi:hypothetical protein